MNHLAFKPTLTKLEKIIRQLEINVGVEHRPSPFEAFVEQPVLHDKPAPIIEQKMEQPKVEVQQLKQEQPKEEQPKKEQQKQEQKSKKEAQPKKSNPQPPPQDFGEFVDLVNVDIRVGELKKVWKHPESENLYCEQIDIGTEVRDIASGLQKFIPIEEMTGLVLVLANLKGRKLAGFMSNGMVLCSSNEDHTKVELLRPAPGSKVGERVKVQGKEDFFKDAPEEVLNPKKKQWENTQPQLKTNDQLLATFNGHLLVTSAGTISCASLGNASIS